MRSSGSRGPGRVPASDLMATAISTAPIGKLIRKTHRHDRPVVRAPPATAPVIPPTPPAADHAPNARARAGPSVKPVVITAKVAGARIAAPVPCTRRAATRIPGAVARPAARLAAEN